MLLPLVAALLGPAPRPEPFLPPGEDVQQALTDARNGLKALEEQDLAPLAELVKKAKAAMPKNSGYPGSLLELPGDDDEDDGLGDGAVGADGLDNGEEGFNDEAVDAGANQKDGEIPNSEDQDHQFVDESFHKGMDPDAVDKDGKTLEDVALAKEEENIKNLRKSFDTQWKGLGDTWSKEDKAEKERGSPIKKSSFAETAVHHKAHAHKAHKAKAHRAAHKAHRAHKAHGFGNPLLSDVAGNPILMDHRDDLEKSADSLAQFVSQQRAQLNQIFPESAPPSSFVQTEPRSEEDRTGLEHVEGKLKQIENRLRAHLKQLEEAKALTGPDPTPSSFVETSQPEAQFKKTAEALELLRSHIKKERQDLKTKGLFESPPDLDGELTDFAGKPSKDAVAKAMEDLKQRGDEAREKVSHLEASRIALKQLEQKTEEDATRAKREAEGLGLPALGTKSRHGADASSFLQEGEKPQKIEWVSEDRKAAYDKAQEHLEAEDAKVAAEMKRIKVAHVKLAEELKQTQDDMKSHPHSKIYAKLRDISLGKAHADKPGEPDLRTDDAE